LDWFSSNFKISNFLTFPSSLIGIEWDNNGRGKHDGSVVTKEGNIVRYFHCEDGKGSFIKPSKVGEQKSIQEALDIRYVDFDAPLITTDNILPDAFVSTSKGGCKPIELLGEDQIRKWQQKGEVVKVTLRREGIYSLTPSTNHHQPIVDEVKEVEEEEEGDFSKITHLDLQENLFWNFEKIFELGVGCESLEVLDLSGNKFSCQLDTLVMRNDSNVGGEINYEEEFLDSFLTLQTLILNGCNLSLCSFTHLINPTLFPNVQELYFANNDLSNLVEVLENEVLENEDLNCCPMVVNEKLRVLDVSDCYIPEFSSILQLLKRYFPNLDTLILNNNPIYSLEMMTEDRKEEGDDDTKHNEADGEIIVENLPSTKTEQHHLDYLSLSHTCLSNWNDIHLLNQFSPHCLRLSHIPLFSGMAASECRTLIIGRIPTLNQLNGTIISQKERIECEKAYLRVVLKESRIIYEDDKKNREQLRDENKDEVNIPENQIELLNIAIDLNPNLLLTHPLIPSLMSTYKDSLLTMSSSNQNGSSSIALELIEIILVCYGASGIGESGDGTMNKRLPRFSFKGVVHF